MPEYTEIADACSVKFKLCMYMDASWRARHISVENHACGVAAIAPHTEYAHMRCSDMAG